MPHLGLIGYPLTHTFSPAWFRQKFEREGLEGWEYTALPIAGIHELPALLAAEPALEGLNVTIPYKEGVIPYLDELDPAAAAIGAVNTIAIRHKAGKAYLKGYNTDYTGFWQSLQPLLREEQNAALVLGTGGASKAITFALEQAGISCRLVSRKPVENALTYAQLSQELIQAYPLIINATPLGTYPEIDVCPPIPYQYLDTRHLLYDVVYNPSFSLFLQKGREQGCLVKNGAEMLELQAEAAWQIWQQARAAVAG